LTNLIGLGILSISSEKNDTMFWLKIGKRSEQEEIMDDLSVSGALIDQTLKELEVINKWLGGNQVTLTGLNELTKGHHITDLHIADLGCGGGDMLKRVANWGRNQGIRLQLTGVDANPYIIDHARNNCSSYPEIEFQVANILDDSFQRKQFDVIVSTLFTHHFNNKQLRGLINIWRKQTRLGIVINDLHRHWLAYYFISFITRLFSKSSMVKNDGPISVLRGFRGKEWEQVMEHCGVNIYSLSWRWAFRWLLVVPGQA
jgi:2-polyprenyl-3-methyl-5-hydroxy-6-metoxy-1,4-benzoquinol methylase